MLPHEKIDHDADQATAHLPVPPSTPKVTSLPRPPLQEERAATATTTKVSVDPMKTLIVPPGVVICGSITAESMHLMGEIRGDVTITGASHSTIAQSGRITGSLTSNADVTVLGKVQFAEKDTPCLSVKGELDIGGEAVVKGDVHYCVVKIRAGADIEGRLVKAERA